MSTAKPAGRSTGLVADPIYVKHDTGPGHPECPERYGAILRVFQDQGVLDRVRRIDPFPCDLETVALCHTEEYIESARSDIRNGYQELRTGDTMVSQHSFDVARNAVGGVLRAVDAVCAGEIRNAFCVVRPPGHHAARRAGMGFCVFNNTAVAARYAQKKYGIERALIVDWDVHHGNGTQDIFYEDGSVFYFSTHQYPWYPGTGARHETGRGDGEGTTLNCPFAHGAGRKEIMGAFEKELVPAMERFKPGLVVISAGFDSRAYDPLGQFNLNDADFRDLTWLLMRIANATAKGRVISVLEGGYNLPGLASASLAHVNALIEDKPSP